MFFNPSGMSSSRLLWEQWLVLFHGTAKVRMDFPPIAYNFDVVHTCVNVKKERETGGGGWTLYLLFIYAKTKSTNILEDKIENNATGF